MTASSLPHAAPPARTERPGLLLRWSRRQPVAPVAGLALLLLSLWAAMALLHGYYRLLHLAVERAELARQAHAALALREVHCEALANPHARGLCRLRARDAAATEPTLARLDPAR